MVLVAEHRDGHIDRSGRLGIGAFLHLGLGVFDRPARIAILLSDLGRRPVRRDPPFLDRGLFLLGVALFRRGYDSRVDNLPAMARSEEHTSELQSLMRISYAVFCLKKQNISH